MISLSYTVSRIEIKKSLKNVIVKNLNKSVETNLFLNYLMPRFTKG